MARRRRFTRPKDTAETLYLVVGNCVLVVEAMTVVTVMPLRWIR